MHPETLVTLKAISRTYIMQEKLEEAEKGAVRSKTKTGTEIRT